MCRLRTDRSGVTVRLDHSRNAETPPGQPKKLETLCDWPRAKIQMLQHTFGCVCVCCKTCRTGSSRPRQRTLLHVSFVSSLICTCRTLVPVPVSEYGERQAAYPRRCLRRHVRQPSGCPPPAESCEPIDPLILRSELVEVSCSCSCGLALAHKVLYLRLIRCCCLEPGTTRHRVGGRVRNLVSETSGSVRGHADLAQRPMSLSCNEVSQAACGSDTLVVNRKLDVLDSDLESAETVIDMMAADDVWL